MRRTRARARRCALASRVRPAISSRFRMRISSTTRWIFAGCSMPLRSGDADVVLGSRFLSAGYHRVLYFWHSLGNRFLTLLSNMLTDLNLTDMETCYKVFRREVIQGITIEENRFGFEPEVVAKIAHLRLRIYEMGISYRGRTYAEGKKIGVKDGFRALYCILKYNLHKAPWIVQFCFYLVHRRILGDRQPVCSSSRSIRKWASRSAAPIAFFIAAFVNYYLSIKILFRHEVAVEVHVRDARLPGSRRRGQPRRPVFDAILPVGRSWRGWRPRPSRRRSAWR